MIQRKQTLFFLASLALVAGACFTPLYEGIFEHNTIFIDAFNSHIATGDEIKTLGIPFLGIKLVAIALVTLLATFKYSNRALQMRLCLVNIFLTVVTAGAIFTFSLAEAKSILNTETIEGTPAIGFFFLVATIPLYIFAYSFIKKDVKLLKSVDRIR